MKIQKLASHRTALLALSVVLVWSGLFPQSKREQMLDNAVSTTRLLGQVRDLVRFGPRTGGTKSGDGAAAYVTKRLKEAGYAVQLQTDPKRLAYEVKNWTLRVDSPVVLKTTIRNAWVGAFSPSVPKTTTALVYLERPDDALPDGLKNKSILLDAMISEKTYRRLVQSGVRALVLISPNVDAMYSDWAMISDLWESSRNAIPLFNISRNNSRTLKKAISDSTSVVISFSVRSAVDSASPKTVLATLEGETEQYYLVCAHGDSDSGGPGADDNASGVSAVLETARVLKTLVKTGRIPKPKYSIRFVIWGTEMFSTAHYVRQCQNELQNILGVLNVDEVGTGATRDCIYFESNDVEHNASLLRTFMSVGDEYAGKKGFWEESTTNPSQGGTDSYVFFPRFLRYLKVPESKIPSMTIFTGAWNELKTLPQTPGWRSKSWKGHPDSVTIDYSAYYHSSLDVQEVTTEKEPHNVVGATKALGIGLLRLAWEEEERKK